MRRVALDYKHLRPMPVAHANMVNMWQQMLKRDAEEANDTFSILLKLPDKSCVLIRAWKDVVITETMDGLSLAMRFVDRFFEEP
jgi:hypothetical protein